MSMDQLDDSCDEYISITFNNLNVSGQNISNKEFDGCTFRGCDFSLTELTRCKFIECHFFQCNLSNIKLGFSKFSDISFEACKLIGVDWNQASWPSFSMPASLKFDQCTLNDSSFSGLDLESIHMQECKAHYIDFREANLSEAHLIYTDFSHSLFNKTNLSYANFSDAIAYDIDVFENNIKGTKFSRMEAVNLLESLGIELVD